MNDLPADGLWGLVLVTSVVCILFAYSFFKPHTTRDCARGNVRQARANEEREALATFGAGYRR